MPTEIITSPGHDRRRSLGWLAASWMEFWCVYGPGDVQGRPFSERTRARIMEEEGDPGAPIPMSDELTLLTVDCYALDENGRRFYDSAFYSRAKGADKSGQASRFAEFEFLGPCRFAGFAEGGEVYESHGFRYVYQRGEPMGREIVYPFIRLLATEEGQTGNVFDSIYYNCTEGPIREFFKRQDDVGLTRIFHPISGEIRPCTASGASKDGGLETFVDFDETHLYIKPELRRMYDTVRRNLTKRKDAEPWSFESSTMYEPGQDSTAERTHNEVKRIRDGKVRRPRTYFNHREGFPDTDLANEDELRRTIIESYGDAASYIDVERKIAEVWDTRNDVNDTRRYTLNQATSASDAWFTQQEWDAVAKPERKLIPGELVALSFDGSKSGDTTVLTATAISDSHIVCLKIFDPATSGGEVDSLAVDRAYHEAREKYDVVAFYADPPGWESYIDKWEQEDLLLPADKRLCVHASAKHSIRWWTNRVAEFTHAAEAFRNGVIENDITHDGNREASQHIYNARRRANNYGISFAKETPNSIKPIDFADTAVLGRQARQDYLALPENKRRQKVAPSIYETRGILSI